MNISITYLVKPGFKLVRPLFSTIAH